MEPSHLNLHLNQQNSRRLCPTCSHTLSSVFPLFVASASPACPVPADNNKIVVRAPSYPLVSPSSTPLFPHNHASCVTSCGFADDALRTAKRQSMRPRLLRPVAPRPGSSTLRRRSLPRRELRHGQLRRATINILPCLSTFLSLARLYALPPCATSATWLFSSDRAMCETFLGPDVGPRCRWTRVIGTLLRLLYATLSSKLPPHLSVCHSTPGSLPCWV